MKIGVIGSGAIADLFIDGLKKCPDFILQNIYSRSLEKAEQKQKEWGFKQATNHMDDFLASDIDIVYIASPNSLHGAQIEACLKAQKHVICEKPIVTCLADFDRLYALAHKNNLFLFEAYRHINSPHYKWVKNKLAEIGKIRMVNLSFNQYSSKYDAYKRGEKPNVFTAQFEGGALNDLAVYPIAFALGLFGDYKDFSYHKIELEEGVDGAGSIILEYDGFLCQISFSKICQGVIKNEILGEKGHIVIDAVSTLSGIKVNGKECELTNEENDLVYEIQSFADIMQSELYQPSQTTSNPLDAQYNNQKKYEELIDISRKTCAFIEKLKTT